MTPSLVRDPSHFPPKEPLKTVQVSGAPTVEVAMQYFIAKWVGTGVRGSSGPRSSAVAGSLRLVSHVPGKTTVTETFLPTFSGTKRASYPWRGRPVPSCRAGRRSTGTAP
jgi:hypothetical protein